MSSTFKFHSQVNETVPWNAQYIFPTQATRVAKQTVKLPPKNGGNFGAGNIFRIEFPADNYLNVLNSVLSFDLTTTGGAGATLQRSGGHSLIKRLRVMYGSLVLEDIQEYKTLVRIFTEAGVQRDYMTSSGSILDGMYDTTAFTPSATSDTSLATFGATGGIDSTSSANLGTTTNRYLLKGGSRVGVDLLAPGTKNYCLNLMSGVLTTKKLIPLKWMASQLSIEITLATVNDAFIASTAPTGYTLTNINYIAEMLEFDSTYDTSFFMGLNQGGVPLKFSSWHFHTFNFVASTTLQVHERSRSVKAMLAVIRSNLPESVAVDSDHFYHNGLTVIDGTTGLMSASGSGTLGVDEYQCRVGGRYYPAQPVRATFGGAEAFVELQKTMNVLGDYTRAGSINYTNWTQYNSNGSGAWVDGGKFIMAQEFECADVMPDTICGINAQEQSDIALTIKSSATPASKKVDIFMHFDALIIVRSGNLVDIAM
jgi:hypothetical protein